MSKKSVSNLQYAEYTTFESEQELKDLLKLENANNYLVWRENKPRC